MKRSLVGLVRSLVSPATRTRLRRNMLVRRTLAAWFGGIRSQPHPHAPYRLYFDGAQCLGWSMGALKDWEGDEFRFVADLLARRPVRVAWDIGANVGIWSLFLASIQPPLQQIVCFEPDAYNRKLLEINRSRNRIDRMTIRGVALSDVPGEATFFADPLSGSTGSLESGQGFTEQFYGVRRRPVKVPLSTIDHEVAQGMPPPGLIKMDVEGHELSALRGAQRTLAEHRPMLIMEVSHNATAVADLLVQAGYQLIDPATGKPTTEAGYATVALPLDR